MARAWALLPVAAALLLLLVVAGTARASLIAVDLGSEFLKVSLIKPGRSPISIVVNEMSKRKSPALVGFVGDERLVGEEAASFAVRYPETTFARTRDLLGRPANHPLVAKLLSDHGLPYTVVPHPNGTTASLQVRDGVAHTAEEVVASLFQYAKNIAQEQSGGPILDVVIVVPAFFGQAQRLTFKAAAELAGLNVLGLINSHAAAALQFGIERDFSNKTSNVILYDQGSGSTEVALVRYSSYAAKDGGKNNRISQLEVKDVDWDHELGSNLLDMALTRHFSTQFADKHKLNVDDILNNAKSVAKMKKQARRTKEILSANNAAPFSVEEFYDNKDFQSSITRETFEGLVPDFFTRAAAPLLRIIQRNNLKPEDIEAVELIGGGTRVPRLQVALSEALGGRGLDRHLDSDEACVLGASLFAANLSTSFRLRRFGLADLSMYGVQMTVDEVHQAPEEGADAEPAAGPDVRNLLPAMKKLPIKRIVHFNNITSDPLRVSLAYNASAPHSLPPGVDAPDLAAFEITGVDGAIKRYNSSGVVNLRFEADYGGLLRLDKAEAVVEYEVMEEKIVTVKADANASAGSNTSETAGEAAKGDAAGKEEASEGKKGEEATAEDGGAKEGESSEADVEGEEADTAKPEASDAAAGVTEDGAEDSKNATAAEAAKNATTVKRIMVAKKKVAKVPLTIDGPGFVVPSLSGAALGASSAKLAAWVAAETAKRETAAAKNELESYVIKTRDTLESDEILIKVTTGEDRAKFAQQLTDMEDWLYMEGDGEGAAEYRARLQQLKAVGEPMKLRAMEYENRPRLIEQIRKDVDLKQKTVALWEDSKPWINSTEREEVTQKIEEFLADLAKKEAAQAQKQDHEDPAFTVRELAEAYEKVSKTFLKVHNKKQPKPPPAPKVETNSSDSNSTEDGEGNGDQAHAEADAGAGSTEDAAAGDQEAAAGEEEGAGPAKGSETDAKRQEELKKKLDELEKKVKDAREKESAKKREDAKKKEDAKAKKKEADKKKAEDKKKADAKKKEEAKKKAEADKRKKAEADKKKKASPKSSEL